MNAKVAVAFFLLLLSPMMLLSTGATAAESPKPMAPAAVPPPPPLPPAETRSSSAPEPETGLEPEITITTRGDVTYEEYRHGGHLYMIKVTPKRGPPYYLIDRDGSGQFRGSDLEPTISIPNWIIKTW